MCNEMSEETCLGKPASSLLDCVYGGRRNASCINSDFILPKITLYYFFFCWFFGVFFWWQNLCNIKFALYFGNLSVQFSGINYFHNVIQPSPLCKIFCHLKQNLLLSTNSLLPHLSLRSVSMNLPFLDIS